MKITDFSKEELRIKLAQLEMPFSDEDTKAELFKLYEAAMQRHTTAIRQDIPCTMDKPRVLNATVIIQGSTYHKGEILDAKTLEIFLKLGLKKYLL